MNQLFDVNAAARQLAVSPWTIRAYIRQGKLQPVRIGRLVRLDEEELRRFVTQSRDPVESAPLNSESRSETENG
jgi:excisionase family DNA binding protein